VGERAYGTTSFQYIWDLLIAPNPNIFMVLCGHDISGGESWRIDQAQGRNVFQLLSNYQNRANGGNGLVRRMTFSPSENRIYVQTFSTFLVQSNCLSPIAKNATYRSDGCYETDANSEYYIDLTAGKIVPGPFVLKF
jgi:hypothetical protein